MSRAPGRRIVVGVDGSAPSKAALGWAVGQAELTGAAVEAVYAWQFPYSWWGWAPPTEESFNFEDNARAILTEAIDGAIGPDRHVPITPRVIEGNPARVLLDAAHGADLLVVGNRGHGGFSEALLGSVGQHCVQHAVCPVVIIPGPGTR
ncbi:MULTISPECIES: universal stress protein [Streptomyces]|uniref:universal stress protein n=1 Tax=Streptomyces TaxID=1883 RepID=UPI0019667A40|nr:MULTISPECIES: universal stress protein [Streptomyces]QRX90267.1 universal stress protein [Streptomyces noursei]UJB40185.1 universal stress protein [Streptomyces sp. A1-5]